MTVDSLITGGVGNAQCVDRSTAWLLMATLLAVWAERTVQSTVHGLWCTVAAISWVCQLTSFAVGQVVDGGCDGGARLRELLPVERVLAWAAVDRHYTRGKRRRARARASDQRVAAIRAAQVSRRAGEYAGI